MFIFPKNIIVKGLIYLSIREEKSFRNLVKSNPNHIVFTFFRLICNETEFALRNIDFHFLSNLMEYDRCDSSPIDFEPNEIPLGSNQSVNGKYNLITV